MDKSSVPVLIPRNEQFTTNAGKSELMKCCPLMLKEEPPPCTFTLCRDIWLLPVRLEQIENRSTTRNGVINITFSVAPGTDFRTLDLNKLASGSAMTTTIPVTSFIYGSANTCRVPT